MLWSFLQSWAPYIPLHHMAAWYKDVQYPSLTPESLISLAWHSIPSNSPLPSSDLHPLHLLLAFPYTFTSSSSLPLATLTFPSSPQGPSNSPLIFIFFVSPPSLFLFLQLFTHLFQQGSCVIQRAVEVFSDVFGEISTHHLVNQLLMFWQLRAKVSARDSRWEVLW